MTRPYRGKRIDNGELATGSLMHECDGKMYIVDSYLSGEYGERVCRDWYEVDPATVGQYTGLLDKRGNKLFEGDVVRKLYNEFLDISDCHEPPKIGDEYAGGVVVEMEIEEDGWTRLLIGGFHDVVTLERFRFWLEKEDFGYEGEDLQSSDDYEIIGNRWDHPHLLKGTE